MLCREMGVCSQVPGWNDNIRNFLRSGFLHYKIIVKKDIIGGVMYMNS